MRSYVLTLLLFLAPLAALVAFPITVFFLGREGTPLSRVIELQEGTTTVLYGPAYLDPRVEFKSVALIARDPEITTLGSSRAMQFRSSFFDPTVNFYNSGGAISSAQDYPALISRIPKNSQLKVVIIALDPQMFSPEEVAIAKRTPLPRPAGLSDLLHEFAMRGWRLAYRDYFQGKYTFSELLERNRKAPDIGLNALVNGAGYRNDGSYDYGIQFSGPRKEEKRKASIEQKIRALAEDHSSFEYGTTTSRDALSSLDTFLKKAEERDIYVIGFLPPYATELQDALRSFQDDYGATARELPEIVRQVFVARHAAFFDLSDPRTVGSSDAELLDAIHGSEITAVRMLLYISERDPELRRYAGPEHLRRQFLEYTAQRLTLP